MQAPPAPAGARALVETWHKAECWIAVVAFAFIAVLLLVDVVGRELLAPALRQMGFTVGALGVQGSQKLSVYALVIGSYAGIGIATATGSHLVPRVAFSWVPATWNDGMNRFSDLFAGVFLVGVAWVAWLFVESSMKTGLLVPILNWKVWPIQLAIPLGFLSAAGRYFCFAIWPGLRPLPPEFQE
ncbi:MAG: TRAP transporter small permease subunit [Burkholderiales bacterium]|nr:TRAP transporter small permease subunit [Burkholderiales bacterium]